MAFHNAVDEATGAGAMLLARAGGRCCCGDLTGAGVAAAAAAGVGAMSDEAARVVNSRSVIIQIWRAWAN